MDAAVIVAMIAALVSLGSVVANLRVAALARRASEAQLTIAAAVKAEEASLQAIRDMATQAEHVRIAGWHLRRALSAVRGPGTDSDAGALFILAAWRALETAYRDFFDVWANAKPEVPLRFLNLLQAYRHDSRKALDCLETAFKSLEDQQGTQLQTS